MAILVLVFLDGGNVENDSADLFPMFVMIESINIMQAVGEKSISDQWAFWVTLLGLIAFFGGWNQVKIDNRIEQKILQGDASESDYAYWYKRKREREMDDYYMQDDHYKH